MPPVSGGIFVGCTHDKAFTFEALTTLLSLCITNMCIKCVGKTKIFSKKTSTRQFSCAV